MRVTAVHSTVEKVFLVLFVLNGYSAEKGPATVVRDKATTRRENSHIPAPGYLAAEQPPGLARWLTGPTFHPQGKQSFARVTTAIPVASNVPTVHNGSPGKGMRPARAPVDV